MSKEVRDNKRKNEERSNEQVYNNIQDIMVKMAAHYQKNKKTG